MLAGRVLTRHNRGLHHLLALEKIDTPPAEALTRSSQGRIIARPEKVRSGDLPVLQQFISLNR
jgi:hypothetical protein